MTEEQDYAYLIPKYESPGTYGIMIEDQNNPYLLTEYGQKSKRDKRTINNLHYNTEADSRGGRTRCAPP